MSLGTMEQRTEGMKKQAHELIDQAYQRGYKKAEEDYHIQTEKDRESSYQLGIEVGRNEAWEAARKLSDARNANEILDDYAIFYCVNIFERHTASEAIEKLCAYEEQKKQKEDTEIHVGDVIRRYDVEAVVTWIDGEDWNGFLYKGKDVGEIGQVYSCMNCQGWKKTGIRIAEIAEALGKMKEERK